MNCPCCHGTGWDSGRPCEYEGCAYGVVSCCDPQFDSTSSPHLYAKPNRPAHCEPEAPSPDVGRAGTPGMGAEIPDSLARSSAAYWGDS